jgi:small nuclear ribonucleoprotein (snRNP)-like protein
VVPVPTYRVCVSLRDDQFLQGTVVALDWVLNPILCDCIKLQPQVVHHAHGPLMFPSALITSLTIEALLSPSPMIPASMHATPNPISPPTD